MEKKEEQKKQLTRRQLLKCGVATGAALMVAGNWKVLPALGQANCNMPSSPASLTLEPYVDPLPISPILQRESEEGPGDRPLYRLSADNITVKFHRDLPPTPMWGFNGMHPGPTIVAYKNHPVEVDITNNLKEFVVCVTPEVVGGEIVTIKGEPIPYITIHNHGVLDPPEFDGGPEHMFPPGITFHYQYPNINAPATYWYHDHDHMLTRFTIYSGLLGFYVLQPENFYNSTDIGIPPDKDIPLAIADRSFNEDGSLWYYPPSQTSYSHYMDEFSGDFNTVNGKVAPYLEVERGPYLFRILNAANSSTYRLVLQDSKGNPIPFQVIGDDEGFLPRPVTTESLTLGNAERANVIIDFTNFDVGEKIEMINTLHGTPMMGAMPTEVMQFVCKSTQARSIDYSKLLMPFTKFPEPVVTRYVTLTHKGNDTNVHLLNNLPYMKAPTETPTAGTVEIWYIFNLTDEMHPIHLHESRFYILDKQRFNVSKFVQANGKTGPLENPVIPAIGDPYPPPRWERGLKDTVKVNPGEFARIKVQFSPYPGRTVWHCHMLEHENNDMMRPLLLT